MGKFSEYKNKNHLNSKKNKTKPNTQLALIFKSIKIVKVKERLINCSRLRETKGMCGLNDLRLNPFAKKSIIETTDRH